MGHYGDGDARRYVVKWLGWSLDDVTAEPRRHLEENAAEILAAYEAELVRDAERREASLRDRADLVQARPLPTNYSGNRYSFVLQPSVGGMKEESETSEEARPRERARTRRSSTPASQ